MYSIFSTCYSNVPSHKTINRKVLFMFGTRQLYYDDFPHSRHIILFRTGFLKAIAMTGTLTVFDILNNMVTEFLTR